MSKNKLSEAGEKLYEFLSDPNVSVGVSSDKLYVYCKTKKSMKKVPNTFNGYSVQVKYTGGFKPAIKE